MRVIVSRELPSAIIVSMCLHNCYSELVSIKPIRSVIKEAAKHVIQGLSVIINNFVLDYSIQVLPLA